MAGAGRRTFVPGEVLTASNVNSYLMDQAVMVFDDATERDVALGTAVVSEGMVSYLADSNKIEYYTGSAWKRPFGTIAQVVFATTKTQVTTTSTSYQNTGLTANITPLYTDSTIIVQVAQNGIWRLSGSAFDGVFIALVKDSTTIQEDMPKGNTQNVANMLGMSSSFIHSETSGSTTTRTFKTMFRSASTALSYVQGDNIAQSSIVIYEVVQ